MSNIEVRKYGDWDKFRNVLSYSKSNLFLLMKLAIDEQGELILKTLVNHINAQDLAWTPSDEDTVKLQYGDETIYVYTGFLRDNLKTIRISSTSREYSIFVGAPASVTTEKGVPLSELMLWLEYGTTNMPPRPLIRPTWDELKPIIEKALESTFQSVFEKR